MDSESSVWRGRWLVLAAALLWSTSGFFAKAVVFKGVDSAGVALWPGPLLAFWRAIFASLVLVPMVRRPAWSWWLVPMTLCFAAMNWTFLTAMEAGTAAMAIWLQATAPMWVLLIGVFLFREKFVRRDVVLITLGLAGVLVILVFELRGGNSWAVFNGLASGVLYAWVVIFLRQLRAMDTAWLIALNHLVTALLLSPYFFLSQQLPSGQQWIYLAAFGILQMGIPYVLFSRGLRWLTGHEASGIGLIEPVLVPIWVYIVWGEPVTWPIVVGGALIFTGLLLRFAGSSRPPAQTA